MSHLFSFGTWGIAWIISAVYAFLSARLLSLRLSLWASVLGPCFFCFRRFRLGGWSVCLRVSGLLGADGRRRFDWRLEQSSESWSNWMMIWMLLQKMIRITVWMAIRANDFYNCLWQKIRFNWHRIWWNIEWHLWQLYQVEIHQDKEQLNLIFILEIKYKGVGFTNDGEFCTSNVPCFSALATLSHKYVGAQTNRRD